jgi:hypothetical protein
VKPTDRIEKRIKNVNMVIGAEGDKRAFANILQAFAKSKGKESAATKPKVRKTIMKNKITRLAAAAVIFIAVGFLVIHTRPRPQTRTDGASQAAKKTPGEMLTVLSLNIAYRQGGMDAVEKQYEKAFKILGPRLTSISVQDLLAECNSNWKGQYYEKD